MLKELSAGEKLGRRLRGKRSIWPKERELRLYRAISWLRRAEELVQAKDDDFAFIALWISVNACSAVDDGEGPNHRREFRLYLKKLASLDSSHEIYNILWHNFPGFVRLLIDNQYVFDPFWDSLRNGDDNWKERFDKSRRTALRALSRHKVAPLLLVVLDRLYVLRNQLVHGGATYKSSWNRNQVTDGRRLLTELVPVFLNLMFDDSVDWGKPHYPPIGQS